MTVAPQILSRSHTCIALAISVVIGCGGRSQDTRWSEQEWSQEYDRAEKRLGPLPRPDPDATLACSGDSSKTETCFLDSDERSIRYRLALLSLLNQDQWIDGLCTRIAKATVRSGWRTLADRCAQERRRLEMAERSVQSMNDRDLVATNERDGALAYETFHTHAVARLGQFAETSWETELRTSAARRDARAIRLAFPLPPPGCAEISDDDPSCSLHPGERSGLRGEILQSLLSRDLMNLWRECEARAGNLDGEDLWRLANRCLDFRDAVTKIALEGIARKDLNLKLCRSSVLEALDWGQILDKSLRNSTAVDANDTKWRSPCLEESEAP